MARLIVKSPYFKGGGAKPAGGYLRYIATRERVEILPDDRPPTKRQTQLIEKLTKDFPDTKTLLEYGDYTSHPTKFNASQCGRYHAAGKVVLCRPAFPPPHPAA